MRRHRPPIGFIEVNREEVASVVLQQRVHPDRVPTGQMVVDHGVGQRDQQAVTAVATLDARLLADTGAPLVGTGRGVTGLACGFALPANRIDIGSTPKKAAEQCDLLGGGQLGGFLLPGHPGDRLR